jgi:hypothetical protein
VSTAKMSRLENSSIDYSKSTANLEKWRVATQSTQPLTLAEKILYSHLDDSKQKVLIF